MKTLIAFLLAFGFTTSSFATDCIATSNGDRSTSVESTDVAPATSSTTAATKE